MVDRHFLALCSWHMAESTTIRGIRVYHETQSFRYLTHYQETVQAPCVVPPKLHPTNCRQRASAFPASPKPSYRQAAASKSGPGNGSLMRICRNCSRPITRKASTPHSTSCSRTTCPPTTH